LSELASSLIRVVCGAASMSLPMFKGCGRRLQQESHEWRLILRFDDWYATSPLLCFHSPIYPLANRMSQLRLISSPSSPSYRGSKCADEGGESTVLCMLVHLLSVFPS
jgi:hypothetical protein